MNTMAITIIKRYSFGGSLVYLTGGAYELHLRSGNVLIHRCARKSKANDNIAIKLADEYLNRSDK